MRASAKVDRLVPPPRRQQRRPVAHLRGPLLFLDPDDVVLVEDPRSPVYDERVTAPVDPAWVANFAAFGILQPLLGRRNGITVEIIDGKRRCRTARAVNEANRACGQPPIRLPVLLRDAENNEAAALAISANEIRWGDSVLAKGRKVQRLVNMGYQQKEVAMIFGASKTSVSVWVSLLRLTPALQGMLERQELRFEDARLLARLPREQQPEAYREIERKRETRASVERPVTPPHHEEAPAGSTPDQQSTEDAPAPEAAANLTNGHTPPGRTGASMSEDGEDADAEDPYRMRRTSSRIRDLSHYITSVNRHALEPAWSLLLLWLNRDEATTDAVVASALPSLAPFFTWRRQVSDG